MPQGLPAAWLVNLSLGLLVLINPLVGGIIRGIE